MPNIDIFDKEMLVIILPFIIVQYGFAIYCIVDILRKGVENLNKWIWILICIFSGIVGPILYLSIGKRKEY